MPSPSSPLFGRRIVVTRAAEHCEALRREIQARGATPVVLPMVAFGAPEDDEPVDTALRSLADFDWMILTSQNAVRALADRCEALGTPLAKLAGAVKIAAVGPATAEAAEKTGLRVRHVAATHQGAALAEELAAELSGCRVLLTRSDRANPALPQALERLGARVTEVIAYRTLAPMAPPEDALWREIEPGGADAILFFSPSAVHHMAALAGAKRMRALQEACVFAAIGPVTAAALREAGMERIVVAPDTTVPGILDALAEYWQAKAHAGARRK